MIKRIYALFVARNLEFWRDKAAFAWTFVFPFLIVLGFAFAFNEESPKFSVAIVEQQLLPQDHPVQNIRYSKYVSVPVDQIQEAITKIERHTLDILIDAQNQRYWINESSPNGYLIENLISGLKYSKESVSGKAIRYIDWLIPGMISMNMMFGALWGIGFVIVRYRKNQVLKRLRATPVSPVEFLLSQLFSRIWLLVITGLIIFIGLDLALDFTMHGRYVDLFVIFLLGGGCLLSMGLIIAARIRNEEVASGLLNMISWPMMMLSGIWFSLEGTNEWIQKISLVFPLTHITSGARKIMLEGSNLGDLWLEISVLSITTIILMTVGAFLFRWE